jgi:predicted dithiol-disulfide oxidoreductase (DUF899 family)
MKAKYPNESNEYRIARDQLLEAEVELREKTEAVAKLRRAMPLGGEIPDDYLFRSSANESIKLSELFTNHDTLLVYSYMFGPDMAEPCSMCTAILDGLESSLPTVTNKCAFAVVISGTIEQANAIQTKKGWKNIPLLSSAESGYNRDYLGELEDGTQIPMMNVFTRKNGKLYHFWGSELVFEPAKGDPRHMDLLWPLWNVLDLTPGGRGEQYPDLNGIFDSQ